MHNDSHVVLTDVELAGLRPMARELSLEQGDVVFCRGEPGQNMYAVLEGTVTLSFGEGKPSKTLGPMSLFGELAVLTEGVVRTADAVAAEPVRIAAWGMDAVATLTEEVPRLLLSIVRRSCRYLLASEKSLIDTLEAQNRELELALDYLRRTREELTAKQILAHSDALTGLYNRRCFDAQLPKFTERALETAAPLVLLMADLDGFKAINDRCGHAAGDLALVQASGLIAVSIRRTDLACRLGGDEFAILLPDVDQEAAQPIAERIIAHVSTLTVEHEGERLPISISLGAVTFRPGEAQKALLARADGRLYAAKDLGGGCIVWDPEPAT